jgi:hypothetical protein
MDDKEILHKIYDSFYRLNQYPEGYILSDFISYEKCLERVEMFIDEMVKCGEIIPGTWQYDYHITHKYRFAVTLSHIPKVSGDEIVCEVGSFSIFSVLLNDLLGYKTIYGIDIKGGIDFIRPHKRNLYGKEYEQIIINIDLNSIPDNIHIPKFSKIFFFEVFEHLHRPIHTLKFFRDSLCKNGELYITCPNCTSTYALSLMTQLFIPFICSAYNDKIYDAHFREQTPLTLKYALMHSGFEEIAFNTFYIYSESNVNDPSNILYPFFGEPIINYKLRGDTMFSVARACREKGSDYPDLFYNFGKFLQTFNTTVHFEKRNAYQNLARMLSDLSILTNSQEMQFSKLPPPTSHYPRRRISIAFTWCRYVVRFIKYFTKRLLYSYGYAIIKLNNIDCLFKKIKQSYIIEKDKCNK